MGTSFLGHSAPSNGRSNVMKGNFDFDLKWKQNGNIRFILLTDTLTQPCDLQKPFIATERGCSVPAFMTKYHTYFHYAFSFLSKTSTKHPLIVPFLKWHLFCTNMWGTLSRLIFGVTPFPYHFGLPPFQCPFVVTPFLYPSEVAPFHYPFWVAPFYCPFMVSPYGICLCDNPHVFLHYGSQSRVCFSRCRDSSPLSSYEHHLLMDQPSGRPSLAAISCQLYVRLTCISQIWQG